MARGNEVEGTVGHKCDAALAILGFARYTDAHGDRSISQVRGNGKLYPAAPQRPLSLASADVDCTIAPIYGS
jgi:hypothetical protein